MRASNRITVCVAAALVAAVAGAQQAEAARPYAPRMSCASLQSMIGGRGAAVVSTSPTTYDRFVSDTRFCWPTQTTNPEWVVSSDDPECFIGYTCRERMRGNNW